MKAYLPTVWILLAVALDPRSQASAQTDPVQAGLTCLSAQTATACRAAVSLCGHAYEFFAKQTKSPMSALLQGGVLDHWAGCEQKLGQFAQAAAHFRSLYALRLRLFGPEHPDVAMSKNNLATVLESLGFGAHEARKLAGRFRRHNIELFEQMYLHHKDRAGLIAVAKQGRLQFEEQMAREREEERRRRAQGGERTPGCGNTRAV